MNRFKKAFTFKVRAFLMVFLKDSIGDIFQSKKKVDWRMLWKRYL